MTQPLAIALVPQNPVSEAGSGESFDIAPLRSVLKASVVVVAGGALFSIETRATESGPWRSVATLGLPSPGAYQMGVGDLDRYVRAAWTLPGGGASEFSANAVAHVVYANPSDITGIAVSEASISEVSMDRRVDACINATDLASGYLNGSFTLPITAWDSDLREHTANIAAASLFRHRGADPAGPDAIVFDARDKALGWLDRISNGRLKPPGIVDSTPESFEGGSVVLSRPRRGW